MSNSNGGVYTVIAELPITASLHIGRRNISFFKSGFYAYVGSALNGLEKRLERHLRSQKKFHWHIDYLLESAIVREIVWATTTVNAECSIALCLSGELPAVPGFGCSDCRCRSHLFYSRDVERVLAKVMNAFEYNNLVIQKQDIKMYGRT